MDRLSVTVDGGILLYGRVSTEEVTRYGYRFADCAGKETSISDTDAAKILFESLSFMIKRKNDLENQVIKMSKEIKEKK